ncbi:hypothetical protein M0R45_003596 [Rubus argutus]|uniref:Uncharacterized protein n=1 Tax=Rubus argutus TaxID=59490 RepID=A0AAW1YFK4_RUBAR
MDDFRSKSYGHGRMELESYYGNGSSGINGMQDLSKFKKGKSANGSASKSWSFSDPELQRKKRVASYKVYTVEGKLKGSLRKSFRWFKETCDRVVYGR